MSQCDYPSAYVVDTHATRPPLPPRLNQGRQRGKAMQTVLIMLVALALSGMAIEACFIYHLYQQESAASASASKIIADQAMTPTKTPSLIMPPSKPLAHLTDGQDVHHDNEIMAWSMNAEPPLYGMKYIDNSLIIQQEGYYHIYSKVFFHDTGFFNHSIHRKTERYPGKSIPLLVSRKYSEQSSRVRSNSYLGGVFHLTKDDALFVKVSNTSKIVRHKYFENTFGAYML
ncbi:tumor necrosis factor ligand superfamily member 14 [Epinephelus fuscoguttatus]|uniref:tumor necrosis factor ligand superfamily member 14 n=1 Tax=Epinephelus fuscoguttatus TaxID=293821 RepID=UPI0020D1B4E2|nr:tumor necrosis factor ligand superfamily member 14 [Epinephelus fuscoguttatus]